MNRAASGHAELPRSDTTATDGSEVHNWSTISFRVEGGRAGRVDFVCPVQPVAYELNGSQNQVEIVCPFPRNIPVYEV